MEEMQAVNVTPPVSEAPFSASDSTAVSFDEIEVKPVNRKVAGHDKPKEEPEVESSETSDQEPESKDDKKEEPDDKKEKKSDEKTKEAIKKDLKAQGKPKTYKVPNPKGDGDIEIAEDSEFEVKVNGAVEKASLRQIIDNYSGSKHLQRELTKFREEQKKFNDDRGLLQDYVNEIHTQLVEKKDLTGFVSAIAEAMGADAIEANRLTRDLLNKELDKWSKLDENQRALQVREQELELYRGQSQKQKQMRELKSIEAQLRQETDQVLEKMMSHPSFKVKVAQNNDLSEEELRNLAELEFKNLYDELSKSGQVSLDDFNPERIGKEFEARISEFETQSHQSQIGELINDIAPELNDSERQEALSMLAKIKRENPDFSAADIREIAVDVYGSKKAKNLSRKLKKTRTTTDTANVKQSDASGAPLSFDDL